MADVDIIEAGLDDNEFSLVSQTAKKTQAVAIATLIFAALFTTLAVLNLSLIHI